jgi:drug/metabolite transporter (DMT)-like permease
MAVTSTITAAFLFPLAYVTEVGMLPASLYGWGILLGLAWITTSQARGLIAYALAHLPAAFSSVGLLLQPVVPALLA